MRALRDTRRRLASLPRAGAERDDAESSRVAGSRDPRSVPTSPRSAVALQRAVGNSAVGTLFGPTGSEAAPSAAPEATAGDEAIGDTSGLAASPGILAPALAPGAAIALIYGPPCTPYLFSYQADAAYVFLMGLWMPYALHVGPEHASVWFDYLSRTLPVPRPLRSFTTPGTELVEAFRRHRVSVRAEDGLVKEAFRALFPTIGALPTGTPVTMPLSSLVPPGTVWTLLNAGGALAMRFTPIDFTAPSFLAGGIGPTDSRNAWGDLVVVKFVDFTGAVTIRIEPRLIFHVHDQVDFCPGKAFGRFPGPVVTIPMSRLEASGAAFGAPYAGPVPFDVLYDGPGTAVDFVGITPPPTPAPPVPAPVPAPLP